MPVSSATEVACRSSCHEPGIRSLVACSATYRMMCGVVCSMVGTLLILQQRVMGTNVIGIAVLTGMVMGLIYSPGVLLLQWRPRRTRQSLA